MIERNLPEFAIEEDDLYLDRYHKVHAAGCRHLIDPELIGPAANMAEILAGLDYMVEGEFEDEAELRRRSAPCVVKALVSY